MARFSTYSVNPNMFDMSFGSFAGLPRPMREGLGYALALAEKKLKDAYLESQPGTKEYAAAHPIGAQASGVTIPAPSKPGPAARQGGGGGGGGGGSLLGPRGTEQGLNLAGSPPGKSNLDIPVNQQKSARATSDTQAEQLGKQAQMGTAQSVGMQPDVQINYAENTVTTPTQGTVKENQATGQFEPAGSRSIDKNLMTKVDKERMTTADREEIGKSPSNFAQYGKATGQGLQGAVDLTEEEEEVTEDALMNYFGNAATGVLKTPFGGQ